MDSRRPKVAILGTRFRDFDVERAILGGVELVSGPGTTRAGIIEVASGADVILAGASPRFDADTLRALGCGAIVRLGVGVDTVDLETARSLGMWIASVPDYGTESVALHTVTLVLASIRKLIPADRALREGSWGVGSLRPLHLPEALRVGIVGFGRIGRRVGEMLAGVGFREITVADPLVGSTEMPQGMRMVTLPDLLAGSDVVTLHAPPQSDGYLIGTGAFRLMREGSVLVNTARGALIDTQSLISALGEGRPALAALDVFEEEPPSIDVFTPVLDRVILTPHMSWYTEETELAMRRQAAEETRRILSSEPPLNAVVVPATAEVR